MKKLLILLLLLLLTGCSTPLPDYKSYGCVAGKTFATKLHADAYALRMRIKGYDAKVYKYDQWWNHGTYWWGVKVTEKEGKK